MANGFYGAAAYSVMAFSKNDIITNNFKFSRTFSRFFSCFESFFFRLHPV